MSEKPPRLNTNDEYVKLEHNPEEEDSLARKATSYTLKKMEKKAKEEKDPKTWEEELGAKTEKEGDEKIKEKIREVFRELAVHGKAERNEKGEISIKAQTDLDGKVALGLIKHEKYGAGIEVSNKDIDFINPGTFKPGKITLDSGDKHGVQVFETDRGELSMIIDHHGDKSGRDTSTSQLTYELLTQSGLLEKTPALDRLVEFVTHEDNKTLPLDPKNYPTRYKTIAGIGRSLTFGTLHNFFKAGLSPTEEILPEEIEKHKLEKVIKQEKKNTEKSLKRLEELERQGFVVDSERYGKIIIDIGKTVPGGIDAAQYYGADTYINWNPSTQGFFITSPEKGIQDTFDQKEAITVRGTMYMKPITSKEPLTISLKEVLEKMTDGHLEATGRLDKFLQNENRDLLPHEKSFLSRIAKIRKEKEEKLREATSASKKTLQEAKDKFKRKEISEKEFNTAKESHEDEMEKLRDEFNAEKGVLAEARDVLIVDPTESANILFLDGIIDISDLKEFKEDVKNSQKINSCDNFDELYKVLEEIGPIKDSLGNEYTFDQLKTVIEEARKYPFAPAYLEPITRNLGLRNKVEKFLKTEISPSSQDKIEEAFEIFKQKIGSVKSFDELYEVLEEEITVEAPKRYNLNPGQIDQNRAMFKKMRESIEKYRHTGSVSELILLITGQPELFNKVKELFEAGIPPIPSGQKPESKRKEERAQEIHERLKEIKEKLTGEILSWKITDELWKERDRLEAEMEALGYEKKEKKLTLEEIDQELRRAYDTGRSPGITDRGVAYWKMMREEFLKGQHETSQKPSRKEKFRPDPEVLRRIKEQLQIAIDTGRVPGITERGKAYWMHVLEEYLSGRMTAEEIFPPQVVPPPIPQSTPPSPAAPDSPRPEVKISETPEEDKEETLEQKKVRFHKINERIWELDSLGRAAEREGDKKLRNKIYHDIQELEKEKGQLRQDFEDFGYLPSEIENGFKISEPTSPDLPLREPAVGTEEESRINKLLSELEEIDQDILRLNREMRFMSSPQKAAAQEEIRRLEKEKKEKEKELEELTASTEKGIGLAFKNWVKKRYEAFFKKEPQASQTSEREEALIRSLTSEAPATPQSPTSSEDYQTRLRESLRTNNTDLLHELALEILEIEKQTGIRLTSREISEAIDACFLERVRENNEVIEEILADTPTTSTGEREELRLQLEEVREPVIVSEHRDLMSTIKEHVSSARRWTKTFGAESIEKVSLRWLGYRFIKPNKKAPEPQYTSEKIWDIAADLLIEKGVRNLNDKTIRRVAIEIASENQVTLINPNTGDMLRPQPEGQKSDNKLLKAGLFKVTRAIIQANKIASKPL